MKNKGGKPKLKRKGATNVFGCDLTEYLENSGQDVPPVLKSCAEFIETHGIVDGIYRLSGVTSNIQKLRQEFGSDSCPDLTREVYLQDIHCVGSLCKLYFRELPNPLLTYELYKKFTGAISCFPEEQQLVQIQNAIQELPPSHYRTLEYLSKHLTLLASFSSMTNMHTRNLALVWAPNLLRSKEIEAVGCNGDAAFLEVRVQQLVIEFILNHVDEIFSDNATARPKEDEENKPIMRSLTLPPSASLPMKLVSLEEAQARSLSACHPARKERRENSLPEIVPVTGSFFHTVLDLPDSKRKLSTKSKKWKSIFNLGRSGSEAKTKLSRNGSVFVRGQKLSEKVTIRPAKSMDSLCSIPVEDEKGNFKRTVMAGGFFVPMMKPRMGGLSNSPDVRKQEAEWDPKEDVKGAEGGTEDTEENNISRPSQVRPLPEQLKVFRAIEDPESEQTSPKMCRMFYTSNDGTAKSGFHGTLFPLEASPRHQRKALNISEPFAVSVPLRVSAVISINSTPCRSPAKDKPAFPSLQESPLLGQDSAISAATEGDDNSRLEQPTVKEEKKPESKVVAPDTTAEEPAIPKKPEPIDDAQPATKTQETKSGWGHGSQAPQLKQSLEQRQLVKIPGDQQEEDEARHGQLGVKDQPEQGCQQQELLRDKVEDTLLLKELASEENSSAALESPWQDVQQELKIVESEEELPFTATAPEKVKLQESESSLIIISPSEANSVVCGSVLPLTRLKEESIVGTTSTMSHFPLFGISSKGSKDSMVCNPELFRKQGGASFILPKLENIPYGIPCTKDCLKDEDTKSDISLPQEQKLPSKPLERPTLLRDELSSHPKEKDLDDPEWKSNSWILQKKKQGTTVTKAEESDKEFSKREDLANSKILTGVGSHQLKESRLSDKAQDPLDQQDEDSCLNHVQNLELVEPWEEHQWVTSPLHSPTFKGTQEKALPEFEPQNQGKAQSHFKKPFFSRSFSLDSKDFVKRHWGTPVPSISANDEHLCNNTRSGAREHSATQEREAGRVEAWLNLSNESSKLVGRIQKPLCQETDFAAIELPLPQFIGYQESAEKEVHEGKENQDLMNHMESSLSQFSTGDSLFNSSGPLKDTTFVQQADTSATAVMKGSVGELQGSKNEDIPRRERPRPSSLNLDSVLPAASFFNFESLSVPTPPRHFLCGQKEVKTSDSVPSLPVACPSKSKADLWGSHFDPQELDYIMMAHATTGRRNSAPVSVSAVRTSFMVKMCQARAVPVIPPKIQYTQVPLPLQTQNSNCRTQVTPEDKEVEATVSQCKSNKNAQGQMQSPKSPSVDRKGKENNTATFVDSPATRKVESSFSNHNSTQDAPVLRRKRTSEGETTGDNPQSSKMERPSGVSKPSYRSRPGRPQSLILFSPPFPIMDHPSSSADSRVLLSPIRSPSQSPSTSPISSDLSGTVAEGVMLRNKMTIPKNGQRLETSTSCFYQPQRRSVILDGRSGRQIE
ncbi:rho GTPase-activating protein 31 isoform X2 [Anolis carolinensis]|uniref:rho GTPase-activating protein 31 isoform X2 n=1 Tax=Anolis carolinensis TaxID=28377 RepID=UPI000462D42B|nr:PREDICTED: rho GTPase-activating protein 31 isoform X2 [Anolis carolinensis]|eukprot:XP_008106096.1 PREDICTED: rho GTPase-activating protein 31 isoform X2 [Anolis carolinensis]